MAATSLITQWLSSANIWYELHFHLKGWVQLNDTSLQGLGVGQHIQAHTLEL